MSTGGRSALKDLVSACLEGDQSAWRDLVALVKPVVVSVCRNMGVSREGTVDVFGQVCFLLLTKLDRLRSPDKLLSYVATTTRREVLAIVRRDKLFDAAREEQRVQVTAGASVEADQRLEQRERSEILVRAVLKLPDRESKLMWHLFLDENEPSYEEIAGKLKMPVASIGPTRARALTKLARILKRMGYEI